MIPAGKAQIHIPKNASFRVLPACPAAEASISEKLSVSKITAGILNSRGISDPESCERFLYPSLDALHNPFLMKDMEAGVGLINRTVSAGENILIYGDYDVDGVTSTAILLRALGAGGARVTHYVPHRIEEGYGLNEEAITRAHNLGCKLIITVDCGITSIKEVGFARSLGIDVLITDHHEPVTLALPPANAIINPHQFSCGYPYKFLAGAGIAFKLVEALYGREAAVEHIDLAAIGTVADVAPLTGENRILVKHGLKALSHSPKPGVSALLESAGLKNKTVTSRDIGFVLGPRLNAPGRIDAADNSVRLLVTDDSGEASRYAALLEENNKKRQKMQKEIFESAIGKLKNSPPETLIALADEEWHPGLIGIIASKLTELYSMPAILVSYGEDDGRGSARSVDGFHILSALNQCRGLLADLGGHAKAAGFSIKKSNVSKFLKKICEVGLSCASQDFCEVINIDREISLKEISMPLIEELALFQPCGEGNSEPVFSASNVDFTRIQGLKNKHLKMRASQNAVSLDAIGFGLYEEGISLHPRGELVFTAGLNTWNGRTSIQLQIKGLSAYD